MIRSLLLVLTGMNLRDRLQLLTWVDSRHFALVHGMDVYRASN